MSRTAGSTFLPLTSFSILTLALSKVSRSARMSSVLIVSMSLEASTLPSTWITSGSTKPLTTWAIASASRMLARNLFPSPSPRDAPLTIPAISTNDTGAGSSFSLPKMSASF